MFTIIQILNLLLVKYSNACLRLLVVILQDLHCLHRSYHNVDRWGLSFTITPISIFRRASISEIQYCLPETILYKIYIVYIDFITILISGVLSCTITPISTFSGAIVSEIQ